MTKPAAAVHVYDVMPADGGYALRRNGVTHKTLAEAPFIVPTQILSETIAEEWRAQTKAKPDTSRMPMTQLAMTSIDIIRKDRANAVRQVAGYAVNELLCYRADHPEVLIEQQAKLWQPLLDWAAKRFGAKLTPGQSIMPIPQPPEALEAFRKTIEAYDDFRLTGLKQAVEVSGSLVLGLALIERHLTAEQVFHAAELDANFQVDKWGDDPVVKARHASIRADLEFCAKWFDLLKA